jgi:hypothetical protein
MPRVKCPHCGAGNQDANEEDTCWQCGNVLGAPVMRVAATPTASAPLSAPTQQLDPTLANNLPKYAQTNRPGQANQSVNSGVSQNTRTIIMVLAVLLIAALVILIFVMLAR